MLPLLGILKGQSRQNKAAKPRVKMGLIQWFYRWGIEAHREIKLFAQCHSGNLSIAFNSPEFHCPALLPQLTPSLQKSCALYEPPFVSSSLRHLTYIFAIHICFTGAAKEFPSQQIPIIFQECQVEVAEKLHMLVFHSQLLRWVPVNHLRGKKEKRHPAVRIQICFICSFYVCSVCCPLKNRRKTTHKLSRLPSIFL